MGQDLRRNCREDAKVVGRPRISGRVFLSTGQTGLSRYRAGIFSVGESEVNSLQTFLRND